MFTDVHAHYDDKRFDNDRDEIIASLKGKNLTCVINSGSSLKSSEGSLELAKKYDFFYASVGVHPGETSETPEDTLDILDDMLKKPKVCAVGEIGLDYYYEDTDREKQNIWFEKQMSLAADLKSYPVVIHDREAHMDCMAMVKKFSGRVKGLFHCYSGSPEMAYELTKLGYKFSVGGIVTFKNARKAVEFIKEIPLEHIMLETDCPYLAPHPHRGERNNSGYLHFIAGKIAEIKNITVEEVGRITTENAKEMFKI